MSTSTHRYALYLRKSTESEDRQKASIPAQLEELRQLQERLGLHVVATYQESRSAKKPGRQEFGRMLDDLAKGEFDSILCWSLDRLARNPMDGGNLMWLLHCQQIREIRTPSMTYDHESDKLILHLTFGIGEKYIDDLARNVRRGNTQALREGRWPRTPPYGYTRDYTSRLVVPDPERFHMVKRIWERRLAGVPIAQIAKEMKELGLTTPRRTTRGGKPLSPSQVHRTLQDPFYAGVMRVNGEEYPGKHEPMITWTQYLAAQEVGKTGRGSEPRAKTNHGFAYRGMFSCGACGGPITVERTINRHGNEYIYYHCARRGRTRGHCRQLSVTEDHITEAVGAFLRSLRISDSTLAVVQAELKDQDGEHQRAEEQRSYTLRREQTRLKNQQSNLISMCADGIITREELQEQRVELGSRLREVEDNLRGIQSSASLFEPLQSFVTRLNKAKDSFESADPLQKQEILRFVCSNPRILDKKVHCSANKLVQLLTQSDGHSFRWTRIEEVRTELIRMSDRSN